MNLITNDYRERLLEKRQATRRGGRLWAKGWGLLQQIRKEEQTALGQVYTCEIGNRPIRGNPES